MNQAGTMQENKPRLVFWEVTKGCIFLWYGLCDHSFVFSMCKLDPDQGETKFFGDNMMGSLVFIILALPIAMFIFINSLKLNSIHFGFLTIRVCIYSTVRITIGGFRQSIIPPLTDLNILMKLLITQSDEIAYNVVDPFGYFYTITFPLAIIGCGLLIITAIHRAKLLLSWLATTLISGVIEPVNINPIDLYLFP